MKENIDPLDYFSAKSSLISKIYIYDKFIALKDEKNGFSPIFGTSTYFSSIE